MRTGMILVVEDDPDCRGLVRTILEQEGFHVAAYGTTTEAMSEMYEVRPDLIVLDLNLPDVEGYEVARAVTADWRGFDVPIVIMTARTDAASKSTAKLMGIYDYVEKPFNCREFAELVSQRVSECQAQDGRWWDTRRR